MVEHQDLELFHEEKLGLVEKRFRGGEPVLREATDVIFVDSVWAVVGELAGESTAKKLAYVEQQTIGLTLVPYPAPHPCTRNSSDSSGLSVPSPLQLPPATFRLASTRSQVLQQMAQSVLWSAWPASQRP